MTSGYTRQFLPTTGGVTMKCRLSGRVVGSFGGAVLAIAGSFGPVMAQDKYPSRPIEFVVPWGPGGGADQLARKIAPALEKELKVSLPVINVAGATGHTGLNKML